jgi:GDP-4-dehydro-6-deoxy-D-mannose reductase
MKLLITGINGFVAFHFLEFLSLRNEKVEVLGIGRSTECNINSQFLKLNFTYKSIDLLNKEEVSLVISEFRPTHLLHLASVSSVGHSWHYPQESFVNNTNIFLNLIDQIRIEGIKCRILSIGSSEEYGIVDEINIPIKESCPLNPVSPYAVARVSQEMISNIYNKGYGMDIIMTRSFNHFGPGQKDIFVVSSFAKQLVEIARNNSPNQTVTVGNIEIVRDFVDVRDVVKAYFLLLKNGKKGETYNICSGKGFSLKEILFKMCELLNIEVDININKALIRPNDNPIIIGDNKKIHDELLWTPEINLEQSISDTLDWWKNKL